MVNALTDRLKGDHVFFFHQRDQRGQRVAGVFQLMAAEKVDSEPAKGVIGEASRGDELAVEIRLDQLQLVLFAVVNPSALVPGAFFDDLTHPFGGLGRHDDAASSKFDDRRLFRRDVFEGVAEVFGVVHADLGDNRAFRPGDDVSRVEAAAETDFDHREIDFLIPEVNKGDGRFQLEAGGLSAALFDDRFRRGLDLFCGRCEVLVCDGLFVQAEPFVEGFQRR